jgi:hypothetical protein
VCHRREFVKVAMSIDPKEKMIDKANGAYFWRRLTPFKLYPSTLLKVERYIDLPFLHTGHMLQHACTHALTAHTHTP